MKNLAEELRIPDVTFADVMMQIRQRRTNADEDLKKSANDFIDLMATVSVHAVTQKHRDEIVVKILLAALLTGDHTKFRRN